MKPPCDRHLLWWWRSVGVGLSLEQVLEVVLGTGSSAVGWDHSVEAVDDVVTDRG